MFKKHRLEWAMKIFIKGKKLKNCRLNLVFEYLYPY